MKRIRKYIEEFWCWVDVPDHLKSSDITEVTSEPFYFPGFCDMVSICIAYINQTLTNEEMDDFLFCLALDSEDEDILDKCKQKGNEDFLTALVERGISYPQIDARWQIAEILRRPLANREHYLRILLEDKDEYVRKRAKNVANDIKI